MAIPPENLDRLREICVGFDVELTVIGRFTGDGRLRVRYDGQLACVYDLYHVPLGDRGELVTATYEFAVRVVTDRDDPKIPSVAGAGASGLLLPDGH